MYGCISWFPAHTYTIDRQSSNVDFNGAKIAFIFQCLIKALKIDKMDDNSLLAPIFFKCNELNKIQFLKPTNESSYTPHTCQENDVWKIVWN